MTLKIPFKNVIKRDGRLVPFDKDRIVKAVQKAMAVTQEGDLKKDPLSVGERAIKTLIKKNEPAYSPHIEQIQDAVEESLILMDFPKTAKAYILYRQERAKIREEMRMNLSQEAREQIRQSSKYFETPYQEFIFYQFYSRWRDDLGRRETWVETVDRYVDYMKENLGGKLSDKEYQEIREAILNREICPSMRLLWSSGKACRQTNVTAYNCAYIAPKSWRDLSEIMYVSMCGAGCGFSVEPENVEKFPQIQKQTGKKLPTIVVEDSKLGWCEAFVQACTAWERGYDVDIDYSKVRPAGARLKTMGGRASGPVPLQELMKFTKRKILARQNRRLTTIDLHDIICQIGLIVVAGGVRRCLPKDTLIHTKEGLRPIQKIVAGQEVLTAKGSYKKVITAQHTGQRQLFAILTQLGTFYSTREHRWATLADLEGNIKWVQAKDLTSQDVLLHIPDVLPGRETALPSYTYKKPKHSTTTREIKIPKLSADVAWLIGYLHGDGYVYRKDETYGELMFACSPDMPETAQRLKRVLEKFGVNAKIVNPKNDNTTRVRVKSNQLANYFYKFKQPKKSLAVPDFILEGLPEIRAAYMTGVFDSDGSIKSRNGKKVRPIVASSIYPDWLRQLRAVLASLGVSALVKQNRPAKGIWQPLYHLTTISIGSLSAFGKLMESSGSEKWHNDAKHLNRKKEQCSFVVPRRLLAQSLYRSMFESSYYAPSSSVSLSFSKFERELSLLSRAPSLTVFNLPQGNRQPAVGAYLPVKVFDIKPAHLEETYDIQVEGDERFVAEGMLVHNSALISLSALDDNDMRDAKKGTFWQTEGQRSMANNSAVYETKPTAEEFLNEWTALVKARSGERGIFNRGDLEKQVPQRRWEKLKKVSQPGVNPCGEIYLQSKQFCNLTSIVVRPKDDLESLERKIRLATLLGTYQAILTNFEYLSKKWKQNCEDEQLLGVSITGYYDNALVRQDEVLRALRQEAIDTNKKYAKRFGKNPSTAITCVKPHGNSGQLLGVGSGMHPWFAPYFTRRVRISATDPLLKLARDQGFTVKPEIGYSTSNDSTMVLEFPVKAPDGAVTVKDVTALDMLKEWKRLKLNFTEHNPSATIYIADNEWIDVANFIYENWDIIGGLSFLPRTNHVYPLAPYEEITKEQYQEMKSQFPDIDFSQLILYEKEDQTTGSKELACAGGVCEVDLELEERGISSVVPSSTVASK